MEGKCVVAGCTNPPVRQVVIFGQTVWICDGINRVQE